MKPFLLSLFITSTQKLITYSYAPEAEEYYSDPYNEMDHYSEAISIDSPTDYFTHDVFFEYLTPTFNLTRL